jgi:N-methylhydantoinase B/oxoprolinase/acetone carboxylase alpha subunit
MSVREKLSRARDVAANYALIEEEEILVDQDGRQYFEAAVASALAEDETETREVLAQMKPFSTTCWKTAHQEAQGDRITWPWAMAQ